MVLDEKVKPIEWLGNKVIIIDQTLLPHEEVYLALNDYREVASAIAELKIRGAPAIGVAAAYGIALGALKIESEAKVEFKEKLREVIQTIASTRPTAKNLFMAVSRMQAVVDTAAGSIEQVQAALIDEAVNIEKNEIEATRKISEYGAGLIEDGFSVLTHCNTGPLATTGYGTALGVIMHAREQGKNIKVFADETRPLLQGARLTTWELMRANIPVTLITDSMAGYFMSRGEVDCVIVGADRITANGDTANKIGTYTLSVLAAENGVPFYVAAPTTSIDLSLTSGDEIPIEQRSKNEVLHFQEVDIAPPGIDVANPAFDVTPHCYITAIITEKGIIKEPYIERLKGIDSKN